MMTKPSFSLFAIGAIGLFSSQYAVSQTEVSSNNIFKTFNISVSKFLKKTDVPPQTPDLPPQPQENNKNEPEIVQKAEIVDVIPNVSTPTPANSQTTSDLINIVAVGDVMIGSNFPNDGFLPANDGTDSFSAVLPYLSGDVVFGNLEGAILDNGVSSKCPPMPVEVSEDEENKPKPRTCYAFRMPERYAQIIKNAGFNVMSLANNHVGDFGDVGRQKTQEILQKFGIHYAGLLTKPTATFSQNGTKYGFVAFAPNIGTVSINDLANAKKLVKQLDKQADIVIVSFHGGAEGSEHVRVPKNTEMYLGENRGNVYEFAHGVIDAGADIVLGHGPHVTRAVELYKDRLIAYSLGNFNTYGAFSVRGLNGIAPLLNVTMTKTGEFVSADVLSIQQDKEKGLQIDPQNQAFNELKRLTKLDFADTPLTFYDNKILKQR